MKALLDSTVLIDLIKGEEKAIKKIEEIKQTSVLYTTSINVFEILKGMKMLERNRDVHLNAFEVLKNNLIIVNIDPLAAEYAAEIYADLRKKGSQINEGDYLIAGACLSNDIKYIITRNEKHFREIKNLSVITY